MRKIFLYTFLLLSNTAVLSNPDSLYTKCACKKYLRKKPKKIVARLIPNLDSTKFIIKRDRLREDVLSLTLYFEEFGYIKIFPKRKIRQPHTIKKILKSRMERYFIINLNNSKLRFRCEKNRVELIKNNENILE